MNDPLEFSLLKIKKRLCLLTIGLITLLSFVSELSLGQKVGNKASLRKYEFEMYTLYNDSTFVSRIVSECSASEIVSYENTPRSIVEYFIASHIRKDLSGMSKVLNLTDKNMLTKFNSYKIIQAVIVDRSVSDENYYVKVFMVIAIPEGDKIADFQTGKDDFTCRKINGVWKIVSIPG